MHTLSVKMFRMPCMVANELLILLTLTQLDPNLRLIVGCRPSAQVGPVSCANCDLYMVASKGVIPKEVGRPNLG